MATKTLVDDADIATTRRWLADTLEEDLDGDRQQLMIVDHVLENGWETHSSRLASLMRAVVETADAALSQPRRTPCLPPTRAGGCSVQPTTAAFCHTVKPSNDADSVT